MDALAPHVSHMNATYHEIQSGYGPVHVHLNYDEEGIKQVFVNVPPIGTEISGLAAALGIFLSKFFLQGGDPAKALKHLNSIRGDKPTVGENPVWSIPHAISLAIKQHMDKKENGELQ